jgi:Protein of unknown function (DUF3106)
MVLTRTWRSAVNKVTGVLLSPPLKTAASAVAAALAGALIIGASAQQAPAPAPAPATTAPAAAPAKPAPGAKAPTPKPLDKPLWATLSRPQQVALEPLAAEWDRMEGIRKQKWLEIANRFSSMKPDEQARVHERMRDWIKMTPEERRVVRENYTRTKKIDPSQKSQQWEQYQQLPDEQKKELAAQAASARAKKQVANLPTQAQSNVKTVAPIKRSQPPAPVACAPGTVKNTAAPTPPCVPAPAAGTAVAPVIPTPAPPAAPVPNAKQ